MYIYNNKDLQNIRAWSLNASATPRCIQQTKYLLKEILHKVQQMRNHDCTKKDEYTKGRYKCSECAYEAYNITNIWRHCDKEKHPTGSEHGVNKETMTRYNTDLSSICKRCNKGFAMEKSCKHHKRNCSSKHNVKRTHTIKYTCKRCGKATIMKSPALRHYRSCKKGTCTNTRRRSRCEKVNHRTQYG